MYFYLSFVVQLSYSIQSVRHEVYSWKGHTSENDKIVQNLIVTQYLFFRFYGHYFLDMYNSVKICSLA